MKNICEQLLLKQKKCPTQNTSEHFRWLFLLFSGINCRKCRTIFRFLPKILEKRAHISLLNIYIYILYIYWIYIYIYYTRKWIKLIKTQNLSQLISAVGCPREKWYIFAFSCKQCTLCFFSLEISEKILEWHYFTAIICWIYYFCIKRSWNIFV